MMYTNKIIIIFIIYSHIKLPRDLDLKKVEDPWLQQNIFK